jgi:hypothetical protein
MFLIYFFARARTMDIGGSPVHDSICNTPERLQPICHTQSQTSSGQKDCAHICRTCYHEQGDEALTDGECTDQTQHIWTRSTQRDLVTAAQESQPHEIRHCVSSMSPLVTSDLRGSQVPAASASRSYLCIVAPSVLVLTPSFLAALVHDTL